MKPSFAPFAALALLAAAPAQQPSPFRFVPADAQFVLRVAAPARWQQQFDGSKFAKLLASDAFAPWIAKARGALDAAIADGRESGEFDMDTIERWLHEYRGELVFAMSVDVARIPEAMASGEPPPLFLSCSLAPDDSFDLAALATAIAKSAEDDESLRDVAVGEHKLRGSQIEAGVTITVPTLVDGHLVMLLGADMEKHGPRWLANTDRMAPPASEASLWGRAELGGLITAFVDAAASAGEENGAPVDVGQLLRELGLGVLESCTASVARHGEGAVFDMTLATSAGDRGLLDVIAADPSAAAMLRWVPADAASFSVMPFDLMVVYRVVQKIWSGLGDAVPVTFDDAMAAMAEATKVRLKEDLLDHLGKGLMLVQDVESSLSSSALAAADDEEASPFRGIEGCYGLQLRDGKAFGASLETLLRSRGLHAARKSEDYASTKVHRLRLAGMVELEYAVVEDLLLVAIGGEIPGKHLRATLDARLAGNATELPKATAAYLAALPKGWVGMQASPVGQMLRAIGSAFERLDLADADAPFDMAEVGSVLRTLGDAMERAGLGAMVGAMYVEPREMRVRTLW